MTNGSTAGEGFLGSWDGFTWSIVEDARIGRYLQLVVDSVSGVVYVGGYDDVYLKNTFVLSWDGTSFASLDKSLPAEGRINSLAISADGVLHLGAEFSDGGLSNIASWNGEKWSGIEGTVGSLIHASPDGNLYVTGREQVYKREGDQWVTLGDGVQRGGGATTVVRDIGSDAKGTLYVIGRIFRAGLLPASWIARWDGTTWSSMGSGLSESPRKVAVSPDGTVYTTGDFPVAGGKPSSYFAVWDCAESCPTRIRNLRAMPEENAVIVTWQTESEFDNSGFKVLLADTLRTDQAQYTSVGFVPGQGTTGQPVNYEFSIPSLAGQPYSIRLKQLDSNGYYRISSSIDATEDSPVDPPTDPIEPPVSYFTVILYPNPATTSATLPVSVPEETRIEIDLFDPLGRRLARLFDELVPPFLEVKRPLDLSYLPAGTYFYRASGNSMLEFGSFVVAN